LPLVSPKNVGNDIPGPAIKLRDEVDVDFMANIQIEQQLEPSSPIIINEPIILEDELAAPQADDQPLRRMKHRPVLTKSKDSSLFKDSDSSKQKGSGQIQIESSELEMPDDVF